MPQAQQRTLSVKVIIRDPKDRVLLLKRSRYSRRNAGKWEFPGGRVDAGETFAVALLRAVRDETGLKIKLADCFGTCESKLGGRRVVYLVLEATTRRTRVRLRHEHENHQWLPPSEFGDVDFAPQFHRIAQRYVQDVTANPRRNMTAKKQEAESAEYLFRDSIVKPANLSTQLDQFRKQEKRFCQSSAFLNRFLAREMKALIPTAEVGGRPKDLVSFAGKLIRKDKYTDPFNQVTDLVGARVVVHLAAEVDLVCQWIEDAFVVDRANSGDKLKELGADRFGYRSVHYVVELRPGKPRGLPQNLSGLKAEIQVRTIAQHAWSDIGHDRVYKSDCEIPDYWKREANRISALLEAADEEFARLVKGVATYQDHVRNFPTAEAAEWHIELWDVVRRTRTKALAPALRVTRVALEIQDWSKVIQVARQFKGTPTAELLAAKGYALCRSAKSSRTRAWQRGVRALEQAVKMPAARVEPLLRLGELYTSSNRRKALSYYEQAFARDASNPEALAGYIRNKVLVEQDTSFIPLLRPEIEQAIQRSNELAAAQADLPRCLYRMAGFLLLLGPGRAQESLAMLARAVHWTIPKAPNSLLQALKDITALAEFEPDRWDVHCARLFLYAALLAKCPKFEKRLRTRRPSMKPLRARLPVVIVAGGCDAYHEKAMKGYGALLEKAFANFEGTVISGGTTQGISGVVGELAAGSQGRIQAVGYLPRLMPNDKTATPDRRYRIRRTRGGMRGFTALEPIQSWLDLLAAGIRPKDVRLLGINGGNIAGLEYRLAVALGATAGVIEGSGREAESVASDWPANRRDDSPGRLLVLPPDPMTLRAFIGVGLASDEALPSKAVEQAAKFAHRNFLEEQRYKHPDPVMQPWAVLRDDLKGSNRDQIACLVRILGSNGFGVRRIDGRIPNNPRFSAGEIKRMGQMEHGRWNVERLGTGWKFANKKDADKKVSPYLVPWKQLEPKIQNYDLRNVRRWPEILAEVGYEIFRLPGTGGRATSRARVARRTTRRRPARTRGRHGPVA